jgi:hypothetical protein
MPTSDEMERALDIVSRPEFWCRAKLFIALQAAQQKGVFRECFEEMEIEDSEVARIEAHLEKHWRPLRDRQSEVARLRARFDANATKAATQRYFAILRLRSSEVIAMADADALGRVLAEELREYRIGSAGFRVREVSKEEFEAYKRSAGTIRL